ncbi:chromosomal replication initiator protein DnaA, partial [Microbacterium sp. SUBG005]
MLDHLLTDDRVTPQLHGFLNLAVPQGVMGGTLYLDVPNDLTAAQFNKRMRAPILEALAQVQGDDPAVGTFRVVVNPDLVESPRPSSSPAPATPDRSARPPRTAPRWN